jgi:predicted transcriptional regulator
MTEDVKARRGRPRPQDTLNRDDQVHQLLSKGPLTKTQIAEKLGIESSHAYLSLFRLQREGRVERAAGSEEEGAPKNAWKAVSAS